MELHISINAQLCKGCGFCVRFCPRQVLAMGKERNKKGDFIPAAAPCEDRCIADADCVLCARICPEGAITIKAEGVGA